MSELTQEQIKSIFTPEFGAAMGKAAGEAIAKAMAQSMPVAQKVTLPNNPTNNLIHGWGSMFGAVQVGIDPEVISTMMHWLGVAEILPRFAVRHIQDFLPFITGVDPTSSTEQSTLCGNCISGESEACIQHMPTARICRETKPMVITNIVDRLNRGDIDLTLLNDQLGSDSPWHPGPNMTPSDIMQVATAWALLFELPPLFMTVLSPMTYTGNPANNNGQIYREFNGFQRLVNTGFVDAFASVACPGIDSDVKNANYALVTTATNPSIYEMLEMAAFYVRHNAERQRLMPAEWVVVMRPELWQIFSGLIPVQETLAALRNYQNVLPANFQVNFTGTEIVNGRDRMRSEGVISLNGMSYRVITDDGIPEANNANNANCPAGHYASDIYVLPTRYLGNRPAMKLEYKDYRFIAEEQAAADGMIDLFYRASPDGRFAWALARDGPCFKVQAFTEPRIILKTPQLAARIQNVRYVPLQHLRSPDHDSPYFFKGGVSTRTPASYYNNNRQ